MTHKQGTHLGGIRTLADLKCRCNIDGDCWLWAGGLSHGKPSLWFMNHSGRYAMRSGRRVAEKHGLSMSGETGGVKFSSMQKLRQEFWLSLQR